MYHPFIVGKKIYFRCMEEADAEGEYLDWVNDPEVNQFLGTVSRFPTTKEYLVQFIKNKIQSEHDVFFAIHDIQSGDFIGTSHFGPIDWINRKGHFGIMIGNKKYWGKGYGTEILFRMTDYGFRVLNLHKISNGALSEQIAAIKYMQNLGYTLEATYHEEFFLNGKYIDALRFSIIDRDFFNGKYANGWIEIIKDKRN